MQLLRAPVASPGALIAELRNAFAEIAAGSAVQPGQTVVDLPGGGDLISYPAVRAGTYGVKVSPYLPRPQGPALVTAWTLVLDLEDGSPVALLDAKALTAARTGATTALAADLLLDDDARAAAIVGSGPVAFQHALHLREVRPDLALTVVSRSATLAPDWDLIDGVSHTRDLEGSLPGKDLVALCTSATTTVVDPRLLAPGALVTSISTNLPGSREIPVEAVAGLDVYIDARSSVGTAAELCEAQESGWDAGSIRGDLAELVSGEALAPRPEAVTYFRSVGLGIEDVAAAMVALREQEF